MSLLPLVLIPGLGSDDHIWAAQASALADVAAVSIGDTLRDAAIPAMAARILAAAPPRFALGAISMGGYVALEIMRQAPGRVTRLALFDTSARADTPEQTAARRQSIATIRATPDFATLVRAGDAWTFHPATPEAVRAGVAAMGLRVGAQTYIRQTEAVIARVDSRATLPTIRVPTLVAVGAADRVTPPALGEEIAAAIADARLEVIAEAGHLPPVEQPAAVTALLRAWLAAGV